MGLLPFAFFAINSIPHIRSGEPENILWICHLSNVLIAAGLVANERGTARELLRELQARVDTLPVRFPPA